LGVGLDAKIALQFHKTREKYPYLFKSRVITTISFESVKDLNIIRLGTNSFILTWEPSTSSLENLKISQSLLP